jgi:hypothetical protein
MTEAVGAKVRARWDVLAACFENLELLSRIPCRWFPVLFRKENVFFIFEHFARKKLHARKILLVFYLFKA